MNMDDWNLRLYLSRGYRSRTLEIGHIISKAAVTNLDLAAEKPPWPLNPGLTRPDDKVMREIVRPLQDRRRRRALLLQIAIQMAEALADRLDDLGGWNGEQRRENAERGAQS